MVDLKVIFEIDLHILVLLFGLDSPIRHGHMQIQLLKIKLLLQNKSYLYETSLNLHIWVSLTKPK